MNLVWRRAVEARGLLLAAAVAALVAVALVTGLSDYNRRAVAAGQRALLQAAPAEERSLLVSGSGGGDTAAYADRDRAVRAQFTDGLGGVPVTIATARYGTGRELTGDLGAARVGDDPLFANLTTLGDLAGHAELTAGAWPTPGATPLQVTLPEKVAGQLGLRPGDRVPLFDRSAERAGEVVLAGTWRPRDPAEAYWRLAPGVGDSGTGAVTSYGPFALDPADFARTFPGSSSASWLVAPDLAVVEPSRLTSVKQAVAAISAQLPEATGLGSSAQSVTTMDRLIDRLGRADLVGRSALLTPLLLIVVLGGYALVLVAALLNEDRRAQTALLRARGAARGQLAGLAVREATLVVAPAVLLAPALAGEALRRLGAGTADPRLTDGGAGPVWAVAVAAAVGCLLAIVLPALRRAGTYVADMAARSRPTRGAAVQRAGVDLALVALAVLAWTQLRQYSSPLTGAGGGLGIDPLLAAAPTLGVLAGAVVALRLLPPATRFAERFVDRRPWTATMFGMWQAGRRPHAGPVLLLALAVGGSTLAWSLVASWEGSQRDQAQHRVGADLRLVERSGVAPADRVAGLTAVPGVDRVLPAWRDDVRVGRDDLPATVVSLDAADAGALRLDDAAGGASATELLGRLIRGRGAPAGTILPATARQLTGVLRTPVKSFANPRVEVTALLTTDGGRAWRLPLATGWGDGRPVSFAVRLPDTGGTPLRLAGFEADGGEATGGSYRLRVDELGLIDAAGARLPLALTGGWNLADNGQGPIGPALVEGGTVDATFRVVIPEGGRFADPPSSRFVVVPGGDNTPAPALLTPRTRAALNVRTGDTVTLALAGVTLPVRVVGEVEAVPATADSGGGVLVDLPAATDWLLRQEGTVRPVPEWWLSTDAAGHAGAAAALAGLPGVTLLDRRAVVAEAARDPYWLGARTGLLAAALGSVLLALVGLAVDVWATARHRLGEFAVLHTLGAAPRLLARALLAEQAFLAGIGVGVGLLVGAGVAATMVPLVILTPAAGRPVPDAAFLLPWTPIGLTALGLLVAALAFSAVITTGIRQRVAARQLRLGGER
ncbi:FtsX-like permease family protein [Micromonospora kangleipakensis]|uniref:FtsX-like permease family protein n=1 Tax=Micromonospora kangleipakensis TaxID=1077942 RepID=A0A4V2GD20_9ACTN|nr:FtsX-like permease family protein [Micromonospora kangleipakensis]RZU74206.1 FtsX-like permease family protein [Micromonospora kangleipakensis]